MFKCFYITKDIMKPKLCITLATNWCYAVADLGEAPGPHFIFRPNSGPKGPLLFRAPTYLKVKERSGSATAL